MPDVTCINIHAESQRRLKKYRSYFEGLDIGGIVDLDATRADVRKHGLGQGSQYKVMLITPLRIACWFDSLYPGRRLFVWPPKVPKGVFYDIYATKHFKEQTIGCDRKQFIWVFEAGIVKCTGDRFASETSPIVVGLHAIEIPLTRQVIAQHKIG